MVIVSGQTSAASRRHSLGHRMSYNLKTVARFENSGAANIAKNVLTEEGIAAFLASEAVVTALWHEGIAFGGIKLQVKEEDVDRAKQLLADRNGEEDQTFEAEAFYDADVIDSDDVEATDLEPEPTEPEQDTIRAIRAAVIGLLVPPVQLVASYYLAKLFCNPQPLQARYQTYFYIAVAINLFAILAIALYLRMIVSDIVG